MVVIGGIGTTVGPLLRSVVVTFLPELLRISKAYYMLVYAAGVAGMIIFFPEGLIGLLRRYLLRPEDEEAPPAAFSDKTESAFAAIAHPRASSSGVLLRAESLTCRFGGLVAIDNLDLEIKAGTIHALIGPNGSGKSTFINLASGFYKSAAGRITFDGADITNQTTWRIAYRGLVRTFQNLRLFGSMTVEENVLVGCRLDRAASLVAVLAATPGAKAEESELGGRAHDALAFLSLSHLRKRIVRTLPHEQQRVVEIARALAMQPKLIMLDEPAAGLNPSEVELLVERLVRLRELGLTILLVEHNMPFVMRVADRLTVLNFGRKIAEGSANEVRGDPRVIEAYLGHRSTDSRRQYAAAAT